MAVKTVHKTFISHPTAARSEILANNYLKLLQTDITALDNFGIHIWFWFSDGKHI